jgi:hypothetical protein
MHQRSLAIARRRDDIQPGAYLRAIGVATLLMLIWVGLTTL